MRLIRVTFLVALALVAGAGVAARADDGTGFDPVAEWRASPGAFLAATGIEVDTFHWIARPIVVFAESPENPQFKRQIELLSERTEDLVARDVVVIVDTDPSAKSPMRQKLRPRDFMLVLISKDGTVQLRKPFPWSVRELTRSIDKMPIRQQEIREGATGR